MSKIHDLKKHQNIAIDMDGTLIDGIGSKYLREWVLNNYTQHNLWIVTFRDNYFAKQIWYELKPFGLFEEHFNGLYNMPPDMQHAHTVALNSFKIIFNRKKYARYLAYHKVTEEDNCNAIHNVTIWKGMISKQLGCTLLIDDLEHMVIPGCNKYGIAWIHPDALVP